MNFLKIVLIFSAFAFYLSACGKTAQNTANTSGNTINTANSNNHSKAPAKNVSDEFAEAREVYITSCSNCHKEDGTGGRIEFDGKTIKADNLVSDKMKNMPDEKFIGYIENGIPDEGMPAFKEKLTDRQIKDVVNYIRRELQNK